MAQLEDTLEILRRLPAQDKALVLEELAAMLRADLNQAERKPLDDLYGLCADLGSAPSEDDLEEARREMLKNFPREDIRV
jgi:hypothetical protein